MYKDILLPLDLEHEQSWIKALAVAIELCQSQGARLHVMHVVPDFGMSIVSQYFPEGYEKEVSSQALEQLHAFVKENVPEGIEVRHIIGEGTVYEVILRVAEEINCDLIVIGSHRPELKDYLLGPNAARVVRHGNCSVLVVRD